MSMPTTPQGEAVVVQAPWYFYVCLGVVFLLLGFIGLGMTYVLTMYTILVGGFLFIVAGAGQIVVGIFVKRGSSILMNLACGLLYLIAGIFAVTNPEHAAVVLTWLLSIVLIITGIARLALAFLHSQFLPWMLMIVSGFITILLGVYILNRWPWDSDWVLGLFFAIDLISQGVSLLILGVNLRTANR
jgi:uncharacterized membrane protein HdeD (DUF308 family)